ncbi:glycosyltransferase family 39 protein [Sediminispirochaeta bajacaliforniensis]|uniref:glycosyltransferase family 39 protein n=1 Tax=Sediminispirochaeta bajacaliforniensis TaxID=148 RepID=UPI00039A0FAC|nr:glycosyltransferase family 39 protein [Sediminispirochaeta bajacaliforniensis]
MAKGESLTYPDYDPVFPFLWMMGNGIETLPPTAYNFFFLSATLVGYLCIVLVSFFVNRDIASPETIIIGIWVGGVFFLGTGCFISVPDMLTMVTASILLYLLLRSSNTERNMSYLFLSGMIIGMATGIKIVNFAFVLALCIPPFFFRSKPLGRRLLQSLIMLLGLFVFFAAAVGTLALLERLPDFLSGLTNWYGELGDKKAVFGWYMTRKRFIVDWGRSLYMGLAFCLGITGIGFLADRLPRRVCIPLFICLLAALGLAMNEFHIIYADTLLGFALVLFCFTLIAETRHHPEYRRLLAVLGVFFLLVLSIWSTRDSKYALPGLMLFFPSMISILEKKAPMRFTSDTYDGELSRHVSCILSEQWFKSVYGYVLVFFLVGHMMLFVKGGTICH